MKLGVDVGGTNTDAVLLNGASVLATTKLPTTPDIGKGIVDAVNSVVRDSGTSADCIQAVMIGTTQFTNAFVEARELTKVGVLRLGAPATRSLPPLVDWPDSLRREVLGGWHILPGGVQFDGRAISSFEADKVREAALEFASEGITAVAISSVFAPLSTEDERRAADIVAEELPQACITLSSDIGRIGLLERENAAVMNGSLANLSSKVVGSFESALSELGITAPLYVTQNDGTLMQADTAQRFPVLTFASGPTNSMRGAAFLTQKLNAIIVDIGGTTTDVGALKDGFPRESSINVDIGGVKTNFRMPDIFSLGLGGGSLVKGADESVVQLGPESVGQLLTSRALIFGGGTLTASDVVVASGSARFGDPSRVCHLELDLVNRVLERARLMVEDAIDRMKTSADESPVILVGGGAVLVQDRLSGASEVVIPEHHGVANAVGAAIAQVGGEVERIVFYDQKSRECALGELKQQAIDRARSAGAQADSINVIDVEEVPLAYLPGHSVRVRVKALGDLPLGGT